MRRSITFYSEGLKLDGDLFLPDDLRSGERRGGIVLAHGYTGVKDLYLRDNARVQNEAGCVVRTCDYKGWGKREGPRSRLAPMGRVADLQAAITVLGLQAQVDEDRIGIYGTSYGGATVVWTAAIDTRVKCVVSCVGIGHGARWMRSALRPDEGHELLARPEPTERSASSTVSRSLPIARRSCCPIASRPSSQQPPARTTRTPSTRCRSSTSTRRCSSIPSGSSTRSPHADPVHHHRR